MVLHKLKRVKEIKIRPPSEESVQLWTIISLIILFLIGIIVLNSSHILDKIQPSNNITNLKLKNYISYSAVECSKTQIDCALGYEKFSDKTGCGCEAVNERIIGNNVTLCTANQKKVTACTTLYKPVCAFKQVECIKAPCYPVPETYSNICSACADKRTLFYIDGECAN
ncbi:MAG: hypothetical protein AABW91_00135 [Nanoarchaeota archaeon]